MSEIEKFVVFGADRLVGLDIVRRGLSEGLQVRAFLPEGCHLPDDIKESEVEVVHGDVLKKAEVEDAIEDCDAVLSAIDARGWFGNHVMLTKAVNNIIAGMKEHDVTKLAILSSADCLPVSKRRFSIFKMGSKLESSHKEVLQILENESSSIDWIAMMAPNIINTRKVNQEYKVERNNMPGEWSVTSGELADFMVKVFMDRTSRECFTHNKLGISSQPKRRFKFMYWLLPTSVAIALIAIVYYQGIKILPLPLQEFVKNIYNPERSQGETDKSTLEKVSDYAKSWLPFWG